MSAEIIVEHLSTSKKIELMEKLWDELSTSTEIISPDWHGEELQRRDKALKNGEDRYMDWDVAKQNIRKLYK